jgi:D-alanyl-D-alanine carboxypeptidase
MPRRGTLVTMLLALAVPACTTTSRPEPPAPSPSAVVTPAPSPSESPSPQPVTPSPTPSPPPRFTGEILRISPAIRAELIGRNWHAGCPVPLEDLRMVHVSYWNFDGEVAHGPLVLNQRVAGDVLWVFRQLFRAHFPILKIDLAAKWHPVKPSDYWNPSRKSVTASFNCRPATDSTSLSQHSYGWAIDINPLQNPYVRSDGSVLRAVAKPYRNRSMQREGMIHEGDVVVRSFAAIGWEWGGHWHTLKDYMHFSLTGR